jgi:hypothetical protein
MARISLLRFSRKTKLSSAPRTRAPFAIFAAGFGGRLRSTLPFRSTTGRGLKAVRRAEALSASSCRELDRLDDRGIVILRLVDPRRDRPHPHRRRRERSHQLVRIGFIAQPTLIVARCNDQRHAAVDFSNQIIGVRGDDGEGASPFARDRVFPVVPQPA